MVILVPVAEHRVWFWDEYDFTSSHAAQSRLSSMGSLPGAAAAGPGARAWVVRVCIFAAVVRMATCATCRELSTTDAFTVGAYTYTVRRTDCAPTFLMPVLPAGVDTADISSLPRAVPATPFHYVGCFGANFSIHSLCRLSECTKCRFRSLSRLSTWLYGQRT